MLKKYKITYRLAIKLYTWELEAPSKYAAKQVFYRKYPRGQIVSILEVPCESCFAEH